MLIDIWINYCCRFGNQNSMCYNFNNKGVDLHKAMTDLDAEQANNQDFSLIGSVNAFVKNTVPTIPAIVNYNGIVLKDTFWGVQENPDAATKGKNLQSENTIHILTIRRLKRTAV